MELCDKVGSAVLSVVLRPATCISSENLLEMQILQPHLTPAQSQTLGVGPSRLDFHELSENSDPGTPALGKGFLELLSRSRRGDDFGGR